ncbi:MAG TPA: hypothetical protein VK101_10475 [Limnochordia bacterium]|nr:hypothetical protein [Limnochordia bacterium]
MGLRKMLAVAISEIRLLSRHGALWKLAGVHSALLVATLLLTWPPAARLATAEPPFTLKWILLVEVTTLAYVTLVLASDSLPWGEAERIRPVHWVTYGASPAWAALGGRIIALWQVLALLAFTSLPIFTMAHGASPIPAAALGAWTVVALTSLTLLGIIGVWIGSRFDERSNRRIAVDALALALAILLFAAGSKGDAPTDGLAFYLNPLKVMVYVVDPPMRAMTDESVPEISWLLWFVLYAMMGAALAALATAQLKRELRVQAAQRGREGPAPPPARGDRANGEETQ